MHILNLLFFFYAVLPSNVQYCFNLVTCIKLVLDVCSLFGGVFSKLSKFRCFVSTYFSTFYNTAVLFYLYRVLPVAYNSE